MLNLEIANVVRRLMDDYSSDSTVDEGYVNRCVQSPLTLSTARQIWLLIALADHLVLQQHLADKIVSHLGVDGKAFASRGYGGHPEGVPIAGDLPTITGWRYDFHGAGCRYSAPDGTIVEVDFHKDGSAKLLTGFFFQVYLDSVATPSLALQRISNSPPFQEAWNYDLTQIVSAELAKGTAEFVLTARGCEIAAMLSPMMNLLAAAAPEQRCFLYLGLGDFDAAMEVANRIQHSCRDRITHAATHARTVRADEIKQRLNALSKSHPKPHTLWDEKYATQVLNEDYAIQALACLGRDVAESEVVAMFERCDIRHSSMTVLKTLDFWLRDEFYERLADRITRWPHNGFENFEARPYYLEMVLLLLKYVPAKRLRSDIVNSVQHRLSSSEVEGDSLAAFLLILFDRPLGMLRLKRHLTDGDGQLHSAAAMLAVIDTAESREILRAVSDRKDTAGLAAMAALWQIGKVDEPQPDDYVCSAMQVPHDPELVDHYEHTHRTTPVFVAVVFEQYTAQTQYVIDQIR